MQASTIKASDVPQWRWSNLQCRQWLIAVFTTYLNYSEADALAAAKRFDGFGANMYGTTFDGWQKIFGSSAGAGIFNLIFAARREEGAVPKSVNFPHWKSK
jgi:hypothetical protein